LISDDVVGKLPAVILLLVPHSVENLVPITAEDHMKETRQVIRLEKYTFLIHQLIFILRNNWQRLPKYAINRRRQFLKEMQAMATMNISVPDPMKDWVLAQVETGVYANTSDYVRDLIRKDQEQRTKIAALQKAITEGFESGISDKSFDEIIQSARQKMKAAE
jgi:antitoxin ParD1/3/4